MNIYHITLKKKLFYVFFILLPLLQSCGGESVVNQATPSSNNIEIISIESEEALYEENDAFITGKIVAPDNTQLTYQWIQTSAIPLTLKNTTQQTVNFNIPDLKADEEITHELTVTDTNNNTQTKQTKFTLLYVNTPPNIDIEKIVTVIELSEVTLTGSLLDKEGDVTSKWLMNNGGRI